jgi:hypothetical protein
VVAQNCDPGVWEAERQDDHKKFEASLGYTVSFRLFALHSKILSLTKTRKQKNSGKKENFKKNDILAKHKISPNILIFAQILRTWKM